ncbi:MAG: septum formation protein [Francisellaceae bacterium]|jgi:septum formation protein
MKIYLASASPRRAEILSQIGISFEQFSVSIDESVRPNEKPLTYLNRIVQNKLNSAKDSKDLIENLPVLVADTIVVKDGVIFGKPVSFHDSKNMLLSLSNSWHKVMTSCSLEYNGRIINNVSENKVKFRTLSLDEIEKYWETGEPEDKAGSYAIQGMGAIFVKKIKGSYSGVVGLNIFDLSKMLSKLGFEILK